MKPKPKLKLFVWTDYAPDYTSGLAFAIAETEQEAKELIIKKHYDARDWGTLTVFPLPLTEKIAFAVGGGG